MLILGLLLLIGAGVVGTEAALGNRGATHQIPGGVHAFGHVLQGSTGQLFLWGAAAGACAMLGLALILGGLRNDARRRGEARRNGANTRIKRNTRKPTPGVDTDNDTNNDVDTDTDDDSRTTSVTKHRRKAEPVSVEAGDGADGDVGIQN